MASLKTVPVLLDWDGVIIDSLQIYLELFQHLCEKYQKPLPIADSSGFRSWYKANWEVNFQELGFTQQQYLEVCDYYPSVLDYGKAPVFEGLPKMLENLSQRHPLVVMSTAPTGSIRERLQSEGLLDFFDDVQGSDDGSTEKIAKIGKLMQRYPSGLGVMVGDTDLDIEAGRANGLQTVGVTYGWLSEARVKAARPHCLVSRPQSLGPAISQCLEALAPC